MRTQKKHLAAFFAVIIFSLSLGVSNAATEKLKLEAEAGFKGFQQASGDAIIRDARAGQKQIEINLSGLKPDSVYTLWLIDETGKKMAGVGRPDYSFRSDERGKASYSAVVAAKEIQKFDKLEVAYHPDGNPRNMSNIDIALKGDLRGG